MGAEGILVVDKPGGWTSHDVVAKLRGVLGERRVGHGGTLDPMATGVLPIFAGRATRGAEFAAGQEKEYIAGLQLGLSTDTQDTQGRELRRRPVTAGEKELKQALGAFRGEIFQLPPMYSAVKVGGKKLYELARKGQQAERSPRPVTVHTLEVTSWEPGGKAVLRVVCSKGTYIRTLCHDIGEALGCGGAMCSLRRVRAGSFPLEEALTLEKIIAHPCPASLLQGVDRLFMEHPCLAVGAGEQTRIRNGADFPWAGDEGLYRVYGPEGDFLMLGRLAGGRMKTIKSFFRV